VSLESTNFHTVKVIRTQTEQDIKTELC